MANNNNVEQAVSSFATETSSASTTASSMSANAAKVASECFKDIITGLEEQVKKVQGAYEVAHSQQEAWALKAAFKQVNNQLRLAAACVQGGISISAFLSAANSVFFSPSSLMNNFVHDLNDSSSSSSDIPLPADITAEHEQHITLIKQQLCSDSKAQWGADVLQLSEQLGSGSLVLAKSIIAVYDVCGVWSQMNISRLQCWRHICMVEQLYINSNSYHNVLHAADIAVTVFGVLERDKDTINATLQEMAGMVYAAAVHDLLHAAVSNGLLKAVKHPVVRPEHHQQGAEGVAESISAAAAAELMCIPELNFLAHVSAEDAAEFMSLVRETIMGTDMAVHDASMAGAKGSHRQQLTAVLHLCDVLNAAKPLAICLKWGFRVDNEFKGEAALWRALNKDPPAHLIRTVEEAQIRFITNIVKPMLGGMQQLLPNTAALALQDCEANLNFYKAQLPAVAKL